MIYVCVHSALRVSELLGRRWEDVAADSLTIDERFCRGDWSVPKTSPLTGVELCGHCFRLTVLWCAAKPSAMLIDKHPRFRQAVREGN